MCAIHFYRGLYCLKGEGAKGVVIIAVPVMRVYNIMMDYYTWYLLVTIQIKYIFYYIGTYPLSTIVSDIY